MTTFQEVSLIRVSTAEEVVDSAVNACLCTDGCEHTLHSFSVTPQSISEHGVELPNYMCTLTMLSD